MNHPTTKRRRWGWRLAAGMAACSLILGSTAQTIVGEPEMKRVVEIRSYNLHPGTRTEFHRLVVEESVPLLKRWDVDLVAYGPSPHDDRSYYLIRAFDDLDDRQRREDAFYGSDEWKNGPRDAILSLIESYTTIVLEVDAATIEGLRMAGGVALAEASAVRSPHRRHPQ